MGSEDQALTVHSKKTRRSSHHPKGKHFHNTRKDLFRIRCYTCDEKGHYARECPRNKNASHKKKGNKRSISTLTGNITHGSSDWLIDSGASKHMTGFKESFVKLSEHESPHKVKLGDDY